MDEWIWTVVGVACVLVGLGLYVWHQERLSRIRFSDERHEHGPF